MNEGTFWGFMLYLAIICFVMDAIANLFGA